MRSLNRILATALIAFPLAALAKDPPTVSTVSGGTAAAAGGFSYLKFSKANKVIKANTEILLAKTGTAKALSSSEIQSLTKNVEAGDQITIRHHLNEVENRQAWVKHYLEESESSRSSARSYRVMAASALAETETIYTYNSDGSVASSTVVPRPNYSSNMMYNQMAADAEQEAVKFTLKASDVKNGAPVSWMEFEMVISESESKSAAGTLKKMVEKGGKIFEVQRLPRLAAEAAEKLKFAGAVSAGVAIIGTGVAVYDYISDGEVSRALLSSKSSNRLKKDITQAQQQKAKSNPLMPAAMIGVR